MISDATLRAYKQARARELRRQGKRVPTTLLQVEKGLQGRKGGSSPRVTRGGHRQPPIDRNSQRPPASDTGLAVR